MSKRKLNKGWKQFMNGQDQAKDFCMRHSSDQKEIEWLRKLALENMLYPTGEKKELETINRYRGIFNFVSFYLDSDNKEQIEKALEKGKENKNNEN
jgi:hypothetical protein